MSTTIQKKRRNPPPWKHDHPVKGKRLTSYIAKTFMNFGERGRRSDYTKHYSFETAERQFKRNEKLYRGWATSNVRPGVVADTHYRFWQEDRQGNVLRTLEIPVDPPTVP